MGCWAKWSDTGAGVSDLIGLYSVTMSCISDTCFKKDVDYYGNDISFIDGKQSLYECYEYCLSIQNCLSFVWSYSPDRDDYMGCWAKWSDTGAGVSDLIGLYSVTMACMTNSLD